MSFSGITFRSYAKNHPKSHSHSILYGTCGPRDKGFLMDSVAFRMGIIAAIRSRSMDSQAVGIMITGGHNCLDDNGIKMIDWDGFILDEPWERLYDKLGNESDLKLEAATSHIIKRLNLRAPGLVFIARDTRETSEKLAKSASDGVRSLDSAVRDFGMLTTPQLHHIVYTHNKGLPDPTELGYVSKVIGSFKELCISMRYNLRHYSPKLHIDCGNGVGGLKIKKVKNQLEPYLQLILFNSGPGSVNQNCGSHYVETECKEPIGCTVRPKDRWVSISGDLHRLIYFYKNKEGQIRIFNGDKIATLMCLYIKELLLCSGLWDKLILQVVLTGHCNKSTVQFLKRYAKVSVDCSAPGTKNLIKKTENSDISIWFESNGHGSVFYNEKAYEMVKNYAKTDSQGPADLLLKIFNIMHQTTGDAFCNLLFIESILRSKDWTLDFWDSIYGTYPSRSVSVPVEDRNFMETNEYGNIVLKPLQLQQDINRLIDTNEYNRVIVRPSGTENVIRIYTESRTQEKADQLCELIVKLVVSSSQSQSRFGLN